tara:strand:+ start:444 stop:689 length:246 start_codon:yes stop_codon:yes gene_type:complete
MKPQLVEYEKFFKKKEPNVEIVKHPKNTIRQIDNFNFYFNIIGLLILSIGIFILYQRMKNKDKNKRNYTQRVIQFYHDINS